MFRGRGNARSRGRGTARGRSRGTFQGRGKRGGRADTRPGRGDAGRRLFYPTRVEEDQKDGNDKAVISESDSDTATETPEGSSDSDEAGELPSTSRRPYNSLLQALDSRGQDGALQQKRRRLEFDEVTRAPENVAVDDVVDDRENADIEETDDAIANDDQEVDESQDPFTLHFCQDNQDSFLWLTEAGSLPGTDSWSTAVSKPLQQQGWSCAVKSPKNQPYIGIDATASFGSDRFCLKEKLKKNGTQYLPLSEPIAANVAYSMFQYRDVYFPHRSLSNSRMLRKLVCLHSLNHVFKTRDKILKNNARLARVDGEETELRDQGFTRPKVLILLPTRHSCVQYVETLVSLCEPEQQENRKRFQDTYANADAHFSENKPDDFRDLFAGNDDDMFRLGLKFTRKSIKYFSQFYNSDIIFASPLGLRTALGADGAKVQDCDFLSSIEIVVADQADAMLMQNWEHVEYIFDHLNLQPKEAHGCDFSRVRHWYLDGHARHLRQTILLSAFQFPALNRIYHRSANVAGCVQYLQEMKGAIVDLGVSTKQTFSRLPFSDYATEPDDRFQYFLTTILPSLTKHFRQGTGQASLLFIPSYADFVRLRNYLASSSDTQNISFGSISEYTSVQEVARARSHFMSGRHSVLLYTERAHHFRRYNLKGVKRLVMYGLPDNPLFYREVVGGYLQDSIMRGGLAAQETDVRVLFSKCDRLKLERIVGTQRCWDMLADTGAGRDTFEFV